jgi:hypothetical protein
MTIGLHAAPGGETQVVTSSRKLAAVALASTSFG